MALYLFCLSKVCMNRAFKIYYVYVVNLDPKIHYDGGDGGGWRGDGGGGSNNGGGGGSRYVMYINICFNYMDLFVGILMKK